MAISTSTTSAAMLTRLWIRRSKDVRQKPFAGPATRPPGEDAEVGRRAAPKEPISRIASPAGRRRKGLGERRAGGWRARRTARRQSSPTAHRPPLTHHPPGPSRSARGVDPGVPDVHDDVADDDQHGPHHHAGDHHREVSLLGRVQHQAPETRPGEDDLEEGRPADQAGEEAPKPVQTGRKALRRTCPHITIRCARPLA